MSRRTGRRGVRRRAKATAGRQASLHSPPSDRWSILREPTLRRHSLAKECTPTVDAATPSRGYRHRRLSDVHSNLGGTQWRRAPVADAKAARQHATLAVPGAAIARRSTLSAVTGCLRSVALIATFAVQAWPWRRTVSSWFEKLGATLGVVRTAPRQQQRFVRAPSPALGAVRFHVADSHGERLLARIHDWSSGRRHWVWRQERGAGWPCVARRRHDSSHETH